MWGTVGENEEQGRRMRVMVRVMVRVSLVNIVDVVLGPKSAHCFSLLELRLRLHTRCLRG